MGSSFSDRKKITQRTVPAIPGPASDVQYKSYQPDLDGFRRNAEIAGQVFTDDLQLRENQNVTTTDLNARVDQHRRDNQDQSAIEVGLYDMDAAVKYFMTDVIKPTILQNGEVIPVPLIYGSPERWSAQAKVGYYRDNDGKLMLPLIMYRRTGFQKNDQILFPRTDKLSRVSKKNWDKTTRYDKFILLTKNPVLPNIKPSGYTLVSIPNYMTLTYEFAIWTAFVEQSNPIIERINFTDNTYWGDPNRFKFRTQIEAFTNTTELVADSERMVKTEFTTTMYGYLLPKDFDNKTTTKISITPKKVVFDTETILGDIAARKIFKYDGEYGIYNLDFQDAKVPDIDLQIM